MQLHIAIRLRISTCISTSYVAILKAVANVHIVTISKVSTVYVHTLYLQYNVATVFKANLNHCFTQDMLIKERLSYNDQLDEQSISLAKKDQLIEEQRKENEVRTYCNYVHG